MVVRFNDIASMYLLCHCSILLWSYSIRTGVLLVDDLSLVWSQSSVVVAMCVGNRCEFVEISICEHQPPGRWCSSVAQRLRLSGIVKGRGQTRVEQHRHLASTNQSWFNQIHCLQVPLSAKIDDRNVLSMMSILRKSSYLPNPALDLFPCS